MDKGKVIAVVVLVLLGIGGYLVYQKSQVQPPIPVSQPESMVKKIDLSTQPEWVQKLDVVVKKGKSANGLENVTVTVKGIPQGLVSSVNYVMQYPTTNKGTQGALSTKPIDLSGATTFTKTIDLGTCSAKSCVRHDGVTSVDLELNFTTTAGDQFSWMKSLSL